MLLSTAVVAPTFAQAPGALYAKNLRDSGYNAKNDYNPDGTMKAARANQDDWVSARSSGLKPDGPEPEARPLPASKEWEVIFAFTRNQAQQRYQVVTMFSRPMGGGA